MLKTWDYIFAQRAQYNKEMLSFYWYELYEFHGRGNYGSVKGWWWAVHGPPTVTRPRYGTSVGRYGSSTAHPAVVRGLVKSCLNISQP